MRCVDAVTAIALHAYETEHMETIFFKKIYTIFVCGIAFCLAHNTVMGSQ